MRGIRSSGGTCRCKTPVRALLVVLLACLLVPTAAMASLEPAPELDVSAPVILVLPSEWKFPALPRKFAGSSRKHAPI